MKAFKVIDKETLLGSNAAIFRNLYGKERLLKEIEGLEVFFPKYSKGSFVGKAPRSIGLMAFEYVEEAKCFQKQCGLEDTTKIVHVSGRPCKKQNALIITGLGCCISDFKDLKKSSALRIPAQVGTIFFDHLTVREDYHESI